MHMNEMTIIVTGGTTLEDMGPGQELKSQGCDGLGSRTCERLLNTDGESYETAGKIAHLYFVAPSGTPEPNIPDGQAYKFHRVYADSAAEMKSAIETVLRREHVDILVHAATTPGYGAAYATRAEWLISEILDCQTIKGTLDTESLRRIFEEPATQFGDTDLLPENETGLMFRMAPIPDPVCEAMHISPMTRLITSMRTRSSNMDKDIEEAYRLLQTSCAEAVMVKDISTSCKNRTTMFVGWDRVMNRPSIKGYGKGSVDTSKKIAAILFPDEQGNTHMLPRPSKECASGENSENTSAQTGKQDIRVSGRSQEKTDIPNLVYETDIIVSQSSIGLAMKLLSEAGISTTTEYGEYITVEDEQSASAIDLLRANQIEHKIRDRELTLRRRAQEFTDIKEPIDIHIASQDFDKACRAMMREGIRFTVRDQNTTIRTGSDERALTHIAARSVTIMRYEVITVCEIFDKEGIRYEIADFDKHEKRDYPDIGSSAYEGKTYDDCDEPVGYDEEASPDEDTKPDTGSQEGRPRTFSEIVSTIVSNISKIPAETAPGDASDSAPEVHITIDEDDRDYAFHALKNAVIRFDSRLSDDITVKEADLERALKALDDAGIEYRLDDDDSSDVAIPSALHRYDYVNDPFNLAVNTILDTDSGSLQNYAGQNGSTVDLSCLDVVVKLQEAYDAVSVNGGNVPPSIAKHFYKILSELMNFDLSDGENAKRENDPTVTISVYGLHMDYACSELEKNDIRHNPDYRHNAITVNRWDLSNAIAVLKKAGTQYEIEGTGETEK